MGVGDDDRGEGSDVEDETSSRNVLKLIRTAGGKDDADGKGLRPPGGCPGAHGPSANVTCTSSPKSESPAPSDGSPTGPGGTGWDPRMTAALRHHVCHVLNVNPEVEGEALVPGPGRGIDWRRVGTITDAFRPRPAARDDEEEEEEEEERVPGLTSSAAGEGSGDKRPAMSTMDGDAADHRGERGGSETTAPGAGCSQPVVGSTRAAAKPKRAPLPSTGREGRIGPPRVEVDREHMAGDLRLCEAGTTVTSHSNFSSVRASACVFDGKWVYEVTLSSSGTMQLGWATIRCPFTHEHGVGDAQDSYAYDGHRVRKWNVACHPYGQAWVAGDVITCCIDLSPGPDGGTVAYHRNGIPLGVAFTNIRRGAPGLAYFPAVSLSIGERCTLNFGDTPMRYPVDGYRPLQEAPCPAVTEAVEQGLGVLKRLAAASRPALSASSASTSVPLMTPDEEVLMVAAAMRHAGAALAAPATRRYFVAGSLLPALMHAATAATEAFEARAEELPKMKMKWPPGRVDCYEWGVQLLCAALDPEELDEVVPELMMCLAEHVRSSQLIILDPDAPAGPDRSPMGQIAKLPVELPRLTAHAPLACAVALARNPTSRAAWLRRPGWGATVEGLLTRRIPNADDLSVMLPSGSVWWPGCATSKAPADGAREYPGCAGSEMACKVKGQALSEAMVRTCTLHAVLLQTLTAAPATQMQTTPLESGSAQATPPLIGVPGVAEEDVPADPAAAAFVNAQRRAAAAAATTVDDRLRLRYPGSSSFITASASSVDHSGGDCTLIVLLRWLTYKNRSAARNMRPPGHSDPTVLASAYFALLMLLHPHLENPEGTELASPHPRMFWDSMAHELDLPLFGGGLSHVRKNFPPETDPSAPGAARLTIKSESLRDLASASAALFTDPAAALRAVGVAASTFPSTAALPMARLWDFSQLLYHLGVSYQFKAAAYQLQTQIQAAQQLEDASKRLMKAEEASRMHAMATTAVTAGTQTDAPSPLRAIRAMAAATPEAGVQLRASEVSAASDALTTILDTASDRLRVPPPANEEGIVEMTAGTAEVPASTARTLAAANDLLAKLREARSTLREEVVESARLCWWHRAVLHRPEQQLGMFAAAAYSATLLLATMARRGGRKKPDGRAEGGEEDSEEDGVESDVVEGGENDGDEHEHGRDTGEEGEGAMARREAHEARNRGMLLPHIPAYHIEALIDSFHALRRGDPPFTPTSPALVAAAPGLHNIISLLVRHFADVRIVNPDIRDAMLQSISVLLQYKEYVGVFEGNEEARRLMVPALLKSFDSRFWIPVSNILLRLCKGIGFGQGGSGKGLTWKPRAVGAAGSEGANDEASATGETSEDAPVAGDAAVSPDAALACAIAAPHPDSASPLFQHLIVDACISDSKLLAQFLDRLFNTLNWTITEFSVAMKEMMDITATRRTSPDIRQHQRKCTVMFELSITLERVIEFLTLELPGVFLDADSLDLRRLTESLLFVLGHTTTGPDAALFEETLKSQMVPLEKVARAPILAPMAGILLNLDEAEARCKEKGGGSHWRSMCTELAHSSCDLSQLDFLCDFEWSTHFPPADPSFGRLGRLRNFVERVKNERATIERQWETEDARDIPEEFVDPILQTVMNDPVTLPGSGQVVDRETIRRHLLCDGTDPFSRSPLDESMLQPHDELRKRIEAWRADAKQPVIQSVERPSDAAGET